MPCRQYSAFTGGCMESLFVYGTLGPGRPNAHILEAIGGTWLEGSVGGTLVNRGWGAKVGYPGIVLDGSGHRVQGYLFLSEHLHAHWHELDAFEGAEYARVPVDVTTSGGQTVHSCIYMLSDQKR